MKTFKVCMLTAGLLLPFVNQVKATEINPVRRVFMEASEAARANTLLYRLDEINAIDRSKLTAPEKKQLRKEVRSAKKELNELGGGLFISVGAIIVILLLLILFL
jgi:hypothetical protein